MIAAITAGGRAQGELAAALGTTLKALAPIGGTTPLDAAVSAARATGAERVVVIGGDEVRARIASRVDEVIPESPDGHENIRSAMRASNGRALLLIASDLPFLTDRAVVAFVDAARGADLALPLIDAALYERTYPGAPPHATRLGRERVVNGSVVYFAAGVAPRVIEISQRMFAARKSLVRMAVLLGPGLLLRFVTGSLQVAHVEERARRLFALRAHAVREADPGLCFDIDRVEDYIYADQHLGNAG